MIRGFYSAAAGVLSQQKAIDAVSNNIANSSTVGYKSQSTVESSFGAHLVSRLNSDKQLTQHNIGPGSFMTVNAATHVDFSQGSLEFTGRSVDFAIQGEGFFMVKTDKYGDVLTRSGQFEIDENGNLILPGVGKVQDEDNKDINLNTSVFSVNEEGTISIEGGRVAKLYIAASENNFELIKLGAGTFFKAEGYEKADKKDYSIKQGTLERANVNMAKEMSRIIAGQGNFQSCSQIIKIYDKINEITVSRIGNID